MIRKITMLAMASLLTIGATTAMAQEGVLDAESTPAAEQSSDEANRAYVKGVLSRDEVRTAARITGADLDGALDGVSSLEGVQLERATHQAQLVDSALGDAAQDGITLSATMIIIILLLVLIIILAA